MDPVFGGNIPSRIFCKDVMCQMNEYRKEGQFCDVSLKAEGKEFPVHRLVLASACEYFKVMFSTEWLVEKDIPSEISLPLDPDAIEVILDYLYTGSIAINTENQFGIFVAADFLLLQELRQMSVSSLEKTLEKNTIQPSPAIINVFITADRHNLKQVKIRSRRLLLEHFEKLCFTNEFFQLEAPQLKELIDSESLIVSSEQVVFQTLLCWTQNNIDVRKEYFSPLVKSIHLSSISFSVSELQRNYNELFELCRGLKSQTHMWRQNPRRCLAKEISVVFFTNGVNAWFYNPLRNTWKDTPVLWTSPNKPTYPCPCPFSSACCNGAVYVYDKHFDGIQCFMPTWKGWKSIARPLGNTEYFQIVAFKGSLYAIGGIQEETVVTTVQRYCAGLNEWHYAAPMKEGRYNTCIVTTANNIYVIGGSDCTSYLKTCEQYNPETEMWMTVAPLQIARRGALGWINDGHIFVTHGYTQRKACEKEVMTEVYNPVKDSWEATVISETQSLQGVCCMDKDVYLFQLLEKTKQLIYFDAEAGGWESRSLEVPSDASYQCLVSGPISVPSKLFSL